MPASQMGKLRHRVTNDIPEVTVSHGQSWESMPLDCCSCNYYSILPFMKEAP